MQTLNAVQHLVNIGVGIDITKRNDLVERLVSQTITATLHLVGAINDLDRRLTILTDRFNDTVPGEDS